MLQQLDRAERMRLMKFVCSFAWADLEIRLEERQFINEMMQRLTLDADERARVDAWLAVPPSPESVDPTHVPIAHRETFIEAIKGVILADGEIAPEEYENFRLFQDLLKEE